MIKATNLYVEAHRRLQELMDVKNELEKELKNQKGIDTELHSRIHVNNSGGRTQFYLRNDNNNSCGRYLSEQKDRITIQKYLQRWYDEKVLKQISSEIMSLETFLATAEVTANQISKIFSNSSPKVKKYIKPVECSIEDYAADWSAIPYECKQMNQNITEYFTEKGERVRSKSELNIANALFKYNIPYKYECPLLLRSGVTIYPDFTVLNPYICEEVYWEHRGMMDDRDYAKHAVLRVKEYEKSGLFLGKNLIITEEISSAPLSTTEIEKIIGVYFRRERV